MKNEQFFEIATTFGGSSTSNPLYKKIIRQTLLKLLPPNLRLPAKDPDLRDDQKCAFLSALPFFSATSLKQAPGEISFCVLAKYHANAFKFVFDLISRWLVPGRRLNVSMLCAADLRIPVYGSEILTFCEIIVYIENEKELEQLQCNLPIIQTEIRLGVQSSYYARRIQEIKGRTVDEKTVSIQEDIAWLIERRPKLFDHDLLTEMQHVLIICQDSFKAMREPRHLSRMISSQYVFRRDLRTAVKHAPRKRHLRLKLFKTFLQDDARDAPVLGVLVGINFLEDKELFEERHLLSAIQNYIPGARAVEESFLSTSRGDESICTLYLEIEKANRDPWHLAEIRLLKEELPHDLKDRIEHLMHPIFMPRNEEEVMRNILSLNNQIKYLHDLPQVIITFNEQTPTHLFFTVIIVRVVKEDSLLMDNLLKKKTLSVEYRHDRSKVVGHLRKKYPKEASVLGIQLPKTPFLRRDHSIDLNKARQVVLYELIQLLEEVRDFNGGMISKQHEMLCQLHEELVQVKYNDLLLENFFYSLTPDIMRTVMEPRVLARLFILLLETVNQGVFGGENYIFNVQIEQNFICAVIKTEDCAIRETVNRSLNKLKILASKLAFSFVSVYETSYLGYIYLTDQPAEQQAFRLAIQKALRGNGLLPNKRR